MRRFPGAISLRSTYLSKTLSVTVMQEKWFAAPPIAPQTSMAVPVLLRTGNTRQLIYLPIDENQTAADLLAAVQQQVPAASIEQVTYQDQVLADRQQLASAGVTSARATIQGSCSLLFPNNWFESPYARCFVRALDISWPPLRQADYDTGFTWLLLLLGLLAAVNSALAN